MASRRFPKNEEETAAFLESLDPEKLEQAAAGIGADIAELGELSKNLEDR
jgi:hypothetical protein